MHKAKNLIHEHFFKVIQGVLVNYLKTKRQNQAQESGQYCLIDFQKIIQQILQHKDQLVKQTYILKILLENQQLKKQIQERIQEIFLWAYSYYNSLQALQKKQPQIDIISSLLDVNKKYKKGELHMNFFMYLLNLRKKFGWQNNFCKYLQKTKKQLSANIEFRKNYCCFENIIKEIAQKQRVNKQLNRIQQPQVRMDQQESKQYFILDRKNKQKNRQQKVDQWQNYRLDRIRRLRKYVKKKYSCFHFTQNNLQLVCKQIWGYAQIFISNAVKQVIKSAQVCNQKNISTTIGDQFRYVSKQGFLKNQVYQKRISQMPQCSEFTFKKLVYPSKLQMYNNLKIQEYETEKQYQKLMMDKLCIKGRSYAQKNLINNYLGYQSEVQTPNNLVQYLPQRTKNRLVITAKIVHSVILRNPLYDGLFVKEMILYNCV